MGKRPPSTVWLSITLLIAVIGVLTWQAIDVFGSQSIASDNPDAVTKRGLAMGTFLVAIWLLEGVPALLLISGARVWRIVVTIAAAPGLLALFARPVADWGPLLLSLKAVQLFAIILLYVGPSRAFFRPDPDL